MNPRIILASFGKQKDNCMCAILTFLYDRKEWVNKAEIALMQFQYTERGIRKNFSPETISRKCRLLAELGLIERREGTSVAYRWPERGIEVVRREYVPIIRDGVRMMREVVVTQTI